MTDGRESAGTGIWRVYGRDIVVLSVLAALVLALCIAHIAGRPAAVTVAQLHEVSPEAVDDRVNINTADAEELTRLPGVGEVIAERIVRYRNAHGPFESPEELLEIKGIGEATLADMLPEMKLE